LDGWSSASRQRIYPVEDGIPRLFASVDPTMSDRDVTEMVKAFYEETPFPNYDDIDSRETLVMKARQGRFAAALDDQLPDGAIVLEAGCGHRPADEFPWFVVEATGFGRRHLPQLATTGERFP
jgi:hypothetical protein